MTSHQPRKFDRRRQVDAATATADNAAVLSSYVRWRIAVRWVGGARANAPSAIFLDIGTPTIDGYRDERGRPL
jgi:hypothetical protein